ncbi:ankyrin repeat domain-containing protein [Leptospira selangorensis]|uniref:ankyrin repeat domain-containing protein n=1 Tax=Leptospira selangorensis TaxID=2484982 RepID=UPI00142E175E|nr:ankyrin repeat domain-containing protein [Leptospira selangorensis]
MKYKITLILCLSCCSIQSRGQLLFDSKQEVELIKAIRTNNIELADKLLKSNVKFRKVDSRYLNLLNLTLSTEYSDKSLLKKTMLAILEKDYNDYPYVTALQLNRLEIAKLIEEKSDRRGNPFGQVELKEYLSNGGDPNYIVKFDFTILMLCSSKGNLECVKDLISAGVSIDRYSKFDSPNKGVTALVLAVEHGQLEIVKELINRCAEMNVVNEKDESLIQIAARKKLFEVKKYLEENSKARIYCD